MEEAVFKQWLDEYDRAWETRDPHASPALFADDGTYQVTPFIAPMRGRQAIFEYWTGIRLPRGTSALATKSLWSRRSWALLIGELLSFVILPASTPSWTASL
jgi:hypothetical protein